MEHISMFHMIWSVTVWLSTWTVIQYLFLFLILFRIQNVGLSTYRESLQVKIDQMEIREVGNSDNDGIAKSTNDLATENTVNKANLL